MGEMERSKSLDESVESEIEEDCPCVASSGSIRDFAKSSKQCRKYGTVTIAILLVFAFLLLSISDSISSNVSDGSEADGTYSDDEIDDERTSEAQAGPYTEFEKLGPWCDSWWGAPIWPPTEEKVNYSALDLSLLDMIEVRMYFNTSVPGKPGWILVGELDSSSMGVERLVIQNGCYQAAYTVPSPGRYLAIATLRAPYGMYVPGTDLPSLAYCGVDAKERVLPIRFYVQIDPIIRANAMAYQGCSTTEICGELAEFGYTPENSLDVIGGIMRSNRIKYSNSTQNFIGIAEALKEVYGLGLEDTTDLLGQTTQHYGWISGFWDVVGQLANITRDVFAFNVSDTALFLKSRLYNSSYTSSSAYNVLKFLLHGFELNFSESASLLATLGFNNSDIWWATQIIEPDICLRTRAMLDWGATTEQMMETLKNICIWWHEGVFHVMLSIGAPLDRVVHGLNLLWGIENDPSTGIEWLLRTNGVSMDEITYAIAVGLSQTPAETVTWLFHADNAVPLARSLHTALGYDYLTITSGMLEAGIPAHLVAYALNAAFGLSAEEIIPILVSAGLSDTEAAAAVSAGLDLQPGGVVKVLASTGHTYAEIAQIIYASYGSTAEVAASFYAAGVGYGDTANAMNIGLSLGAGDVAKSMLAGGIPHVCIGVGLWDGLHLGSNAIAQTLKGIGWASQIVVKSLSGLSLGNDVIAYALVTAGFAVDYIAQGLQLGLQLTNDLIATAMYGAGILVADIAKALHDGLNIWEGLVAEAFYLAGFAAETIGQALSSAFSLTYDALGSVLVRAGIPSTVAALALWGLQIGTDLVAHALWYGGLALDIVAKTLDEALSMASDEVAWALCTANFALDFVATSLKEGLELTAALVANALFLSGVPSLDEIAKLMKDTFAWAVDQVADLFKYTFDVINEVAEKALYYAGYAVDKIKEAVEDLWGSVSSWFTGLFSWLF